MQLSRRDQNGRALRISRRRFLKSALLLGAGLTSLRFDPLDPRAPAVVRAAGDLLWGPYLQNSTTSSIVVMWATASSGASEVRYSTGGGAEIVVAATSNYVLRPGATVPYGTYDSFYIQSATLTGLTPGVSYSYRVLTGGVELGASAFKPARPANETAFSFVVIGDSGTANTHQKQVAARIEQLAPEFILHCGDMIAYSPAQPTVYDEWHAKLFAIYAGYVQLLDRIPFFPSIGNHDFQDFSDGLTPYLNIFDLPKNATVAADREKYYSFDYGNAHFITLNVYQSFTAGSAQYNWLVQDLQSTSQFWKIVWLQTGPYSSNAWGGAIPGSSEATTNRNIRQILVPIFQQYDVDIVLAGDQHIYERSMPWAKTSDPADLGTATPIDQGGILYVITGGGGAGLGNVQTGTNRGPWSQPPGGAMFKAYHATRIAINGAVLTLEAYEEVNGTLANPFDTFTIDRSYELANDLYGGAVSPESGGVGTTFTFQVTYTNSGNQPPAQAHLLLDSLAPITMTVVGGTYVGGAVYQYATNSLSFGAHQFAFDFGPGLRLPASGTIAKPTVDDAPAVPNPVTPPNGATGVQPTGLTLIWTGGDPNAGAGDSVRYDVYLGSPALPASPTQSDLTATSYTPPAGALAYGTAYQWKVVARDSLGATSAPASPWTFTTVAAPHQPPTAPTSPNPADNATGVAPSVMLSWATSTSPDGDPIVYDVTLQGNVVATDLESPSFTASGLAYGTSYAWQVTARSAGGATTGPEWHFATQPDLPPQLSGGAVDPPTGTPQTTFTFEVTYSDPYGRPATTATVVIDGVPQPMTLALGDPTSGALHSLATQLAAGDHTYRFEFANQDGGVAQFPASGTASLTVVGPHQPPTAPTSPNPADNATGVAPDVTLSWAAATSPNNDPIVYDVTLQGNVVATDLESPSFTASGLAYGTSYAWQVTARSAGGAITGPEWHFTTQANQPPAGTPQLNNGAVTPPAGTPQTTFMFEVTYSDPQARPATTATVVIDGVSHAMTLAGGSPATGAIYQHATKLAAGTHTYRFVFVNQGGQVSLPPAGTASLTVRYGVWLPFVKK
jgi:hypothetical protein